MRKKKPLVTFATSGLSPLFSFHYLRLRLLRSLLSLAFLIFFFRIWSSTSMMYSQNRIINNANPQSGSAHNKNIISLSITLLPPTIEGVMLAISFLFIQQSEESSIILVICILATWYCFVVSRTSGHILQNMTC